MPGLMLLTGLSVISQRMTNLVSSNSPISASMSEAAFSLLTDTMVDRSSTDSKLRLSSDILSSIPSIPLDTVLTIGIFLPENNGGDW